ncbi:MAG: hypothetical protein J5644_08585, partial [Bacteroidales bacterium]|nr:hypothetical protein [Bacteroidales bacterium]
ATPAGDSTVVVITDAEGDHRFVLYNGAQGPKGDKGDQGDPGEPGLKGDKGDQGDPGVSPTVVATSAGDSTVVVITDAEGDQRFVLYNGAQGPKGDKGDQGDPGEPGLKGDKGDQGDPGVSPTVVATPAGDSTVVVITDTEGDHRFVLYNGAQGPKGEQGPAGVGVPQTLSIVGTSLTISDGNTVQIPTVGGTNGLSAYEVWLQQGHTGSEADFLDSLKGATGATGPQGPQGETGATGPEGPAGVGIPQTLYLEGYYLSISDGNYVMLPEGFSGSYLELTDKPLFHNVATTGNYNDLNNKPEIPTIPTVVSAFDNDAGYITKDSVPTNLSAFTNDAGFLVADDLTSLNNQISAQQAAVEDLQQQVGNIPVNCPPTVQDFDGNSYNTVRIGNQCWMKENLRAVHYADGSDVMNYSHVKDSAVYDLTYGLVYDWDAVMNGTPASTSATDRVQGICPSGWHLPSVAEINMLVNYVGSQSEYVCGGSSAAIAKALSTTTGWSSVAAGDTCLPGYHPELNNATGLSIQPAGYYFSPRNSYRYFGESGYFWTSSPSLIEAGCSYGIEYNEPEVIVITNSDMTSVRNHVRCLRDNSLSDAVNGLNETINDVQQEMQQEVENATFVCGTTTVSDYDGNVYNTVKIGNQCWLKENIRTTHYTDGTEIPVGSGGENDGIYRCYPDNNESNVAVYGYLYPWNAAMRGASSSTANPSGVQGICPVGWHVPSPAEWTQLTNYVSGRSEFLCGGNIGKALSMPMGWLAPADSCGSGNPVGGNATGFSALPAGGEALPFGSSATFWSARAMEYMGDYFEIYYDGVANLYKNDLYEGLSVRCVRDELSQMDNVMDNLKQNLLEQMRNMIAPLQEQINQLQNDINQQQHTIDSLNREVVLSTCGLITVSDYDGNEYPTVRIGNQCWMKENLRTTHYANGDEIHLGTSASATTPYRYNPNDDASNVITYGYLYNWPAVMNGAASSSANPSGVQGICPNGWHVPSDAEWTQLTDYVGSQTQYQCNNSSGNIAKALASTTGWNSSTNTCAVGNNPSTNNTTGFSALPAGNYTGTYYDFDSGAGFWSATEPNDDFAYYHTLGYQGAYVNKHGFFKYGGFSVRCLRD